MVKSNPITNAAITNALEFHVALAASKEPPEDRVAFWEHLDTLAGLTSEQWHALSASLAFGDGLIAGAVIGAAIQRHRPGTDLSAFVRSVIAATADGLSGSANRRLRREAEPEWILRYVEGQVTVTLPALLKRAREASAQTASADAEPPAIGNLPAIPDLDALASSLWTGAADDDNDEECGSSD